MSDVSVIHPATLLALIALLLGLGSIAFAAHAVGELAEQYSDFVQKHINGLRTELHQKNREQAQALEALLKDLRTGSRLAAQNDREINDLKTLVTRMVTRVAEIDAADAARGTPQRAARPPGLRAVKS
jgi:hypothetical protein